MADKSGFGQLAFGFGGALVGSLIGYPGLGFVGGALLGTYIFAQKSDTGDMPNLASMPIQRSNKGTPVPIVYGTVRAAGNIIWMGDLNPYTIKHSAGGGKGGLAGGGSASTTETRYRRSFLIGICQGPATIGRAWKGKVEIGVDDFTTFEGLDNVGIGLLTGEDFSENKHTLCAFFTDYDLGSSQAIPNFIFEVNSTPRDYPIIQELAPADIPTIPATPGDAVPSTPTSITNRAGLEAIVAGTDYTIDADISLSGSDWTPIADYDGTIEGNDFTISDMTIDAAASSEQGFFALLSAGARVQNLNFTDCSVTANVESAIFCGHIDTQDDIILKNIVFTDCILVGGGNNGMLVGYVEASQGDIQFFDCDVVGGSVSGAASNDSDIGGLIGVHGIQSGVTGTDNIVRCTSSAVMLEGTIMGCLIGSCNGAQTADVITGVLNIHTCSATGAVDTTGGASIGGLIGQGGVFAVTTCFATGNITHTEDDGQAQEMGGFIGFLTGYHTVINSYSTGNIHVTFVSSASSGCGATFVGGFSGKNDGNYASTLRCYATGNVTIDNFATGTKTTFGVGGFAGMFASSDALPNSGTINRCWAEGAITLGDASQNLSTGGGTGGFVGHVYDNPPTIDDCYSWSSISSTETPETSFTYIGGFVGSMGTGGSAAQAVLTATNVYHAVPGERNGVVNDADQLTPSGGILGRTGAFNMVCISCYWDNQTDGPALSVPFASRPVCAAVNTNNVSKPLDRARQTFPMKTESNYAGWDISDVEAAGESIWYMVPQTVRDENPSYIIRDLLTNQIYGAEIDEDVYIDWTSFDEIYDYCQNDDYLISVLIDETKFVGDWIDFINSHFRGYIFMSEGKIKLGAFREQTPISPGIVQSDLVVDPGPNPAPPVHIVKRKRDQTFNRVEVTWENRSKIYDMSVAEARDETDQRVIRKITKKTIKLTGIKREVLANKMRWYLLFDSMHRFTILNFILSYKSMLWEQGDVTTITDGYLLTDFPIRILSINKSKDGRILQVEAIEDTPELYAAVDAITLQTTDRIPDEIPTLVNSQIAIKEDLNDRVLNLSMTPGSANTNGWDIYRSYDNVSYNFMGRAVIDGVTSGDANATGTLVNRLISYPVGCHRPDDVLIVDIGTVTDLDTSITDEDFFNGRKFLKIGNEIIGYKTCVETATEGIWEITGLLRGMFNTLPVAHEVGETMQTLTSDFTYVYQESDIGQLIYFKAVTFFGDTIEDISDVTAVSHTVSGLAFKPLPVSLMRIQNRDSKTTFKTDDVNVTWEFCSKTTGFGRGGYGQALWGSYTEDIDQLAQFKVELEDSDGVTITEDTYDLTDFGQPPVLEILEADRSGNTTIKVKLTPGSNLIADETRDITITKI